MEHHFRAFTFVDRITSVQPGVRIRGAYAIPAGLESFPFPLVAESVGQCAAWAAMAALDFQVRPVAGIAGGIELLRPVRPGQELELAAEIESVDAQAVAYSGTASVAGSPVIRLQHCVGPMVSLAEFDDPQQVRDRFVLLCGGGATPGGFDGAGPVAFERLGGETGLSARARLTVPSAAALFADHFPRRPVFPGTLLMHHNLILASGLAAEIPPARWTPVSVSDVKLRAFIAPGEVLEIEARVQERLEDTIMMTVETRRGTRAVGGAKVFFKPEAR
jgi:3-hydroxyacyl-[acyl-carrier-protein] dehydratase